MLYLTRKLGESIIINGDIELTVVEVKGKAAKLGFTFPPSASVLRKEIHDKISQENQAAAAAALPDDDLMAALAKLRPSTPEPNDSNTPPEKKEK